MGLITNRHLRGGKRHNDDDDYVPDPNAGPNPGIQALQNSVPRRSSFKGGATLAGETRKPNRVKFVDDTSDRIAKGIPEESKRERNMWRADGSRGDAGPLCVYHPCRAKRHARYRWTRVRRVRVSV